jgi:hypothetical protein
MKKLKVLPIMCLTLFLASTVRAQIAPGVNNAELKGDYAFSFDGMTTGGGGAFTVFAAVGRFTADGAGNLTNGEIDVNGASPTDRLAAQSFTGTYSIGADHRGIMSLNIPGGGTLAFAMLANGNAKFVEVDAGGGHGSVGSGSIEKADTTAFSTAKITGEYAFGIAGLDGFNTRTAVAGRLTASGMGTFTNGVADANQAGRYTSGVAIVAGSYSVSETTTGRGVMTLPGVLGVPPQNLNFVSYVVNAGKMFAMEIDAVTAMTPLLNGAMFQQQFPVGGFATSAMNGNTVVYLTGRTTCAGATIPGSDVIAGLLSTDGVGIATLTYDQNCEGTSTSASLTGTYDVTGNGRAAFRIGGAYIVAYLVSSNQGFFILPDGPAWSGYGEAQAAGSFSNSTVVGRYAGVTTAAATLGVTTFSGEFTADGASPTGNIAGTEDIGAPSGPTLGASVNATYSISSLPTNGRGTIAGNIGGNGVIYVISASKFVVASMSDANPAILIFEQ